MPPVSIKRASTLFLKAVIVVIGIAVIVLCVFLFPAMWSIDARQMPQFMYVIYPGFIGFFATVIPFFIALYQAFTLLQNIDANNAFSETSVTALKRIQYCAVAMSVLYAAGMPLVVVFAELDDAPGAILIGAAIVFAPLIVATFAGVVQKLVQNAVDMKTEQDFTV